MTSGALHVAVVVRIDERERAFIEFKSFDRATQRDPKFLVEAGEVGDAGAVVHADLSHSTG